jgi:broad specificity phosphatase PhoE
MCCGRSPQQVTERLDRLIAKIRDIQRPHMNGEKPADVVVVRKGTKTGETPTDAMQVAHGMSLRCFVKRWLGYPLDMPLALMLSPGAIGILRCVLVHIRRWRSGMLMVEKVT